MSDKPENQPKPGPYDQVAEPMLEGFDPMNPFRVRDKKNAKRTLPRQQYASGSTNNDDMDPFDGS